MTTVRVGGGEPAGSHGLTPPAGVGFPGFALSPTPANARRAQT